MTAHYRCLGAEGMRRVSAGWCVVFEVPHVQCVYFLYVHCTDGWTRAVFLCLLADDRCRKLAC